MKHFNTIREFFADDGHQSTQNWIQLQIRRQQATPAPNEYIDSLPTITTRLKERHARSKFFYEAARFFKSCGRSWDSYFPGWRSGIAGFSILATLVLVANVAALIWTATHLDPLSNYATVTVQNCKTVDDTTAWIQLGINVLSVVLLAGSNYCMQCLSSPTRAEVDAAHAKGSYLNIGILSLRNVLSFRKRRIALLLALGLSSVPLHFVYASSVSIMYPNQIYDIVVVAPAFFSGVDFRLNNAARYYTGDQYRDDLDRRFRMMYQHRLSTLQDLTLDGQIFNESRWTKLSVAECVTYGTYGTYHGSVLLVTEDDFERIELGKEPERRLGIGYPVYEYDRFIMSMWTTPRDRFLNIPQNISYCLSLKVPGSCSLQLHLWFLLTVVACNVVKLACLVFTYKEQRGTPLVVVGDAVASFLSSSCPTTKKMCLFSEDRLSASLKEDEEVHGGHGGSTPIQYQPTSLRYYQSISFIRWITYSTSCALLILISSYWWNKIRIKYRNEGLDVSIRALWNLGFANIRPESSHFPGGPWCYYPTLWRSYTCSPNPFFVAAIPQLAISSIYIAVNHKITAMVQLRDWTRLASHPQPLRVSNPVPSSAQVSTYWLSLPYRYSLTLLSSSALLGWFASQALFVSRIINYNDDGSFYSNNNSTWARRLPDPDGIEPAIWYGVGWSAMGVILSIFVGGCVFVLSLALGMQKCAPGLPLGPTNSLVIAAACHPPKNDCNAAERPVQWGEVQSDSNTEESDAVRHCTITSRKVKSPEPGRWYA